MDQGSNKNHSPAYNFTPTVTKFCVMWEGLSLPHDTKFGNCRCKIVDSRSFHSWSLIHGLRWSGLIKAEPACQSWGYPFHESSHDTTKLEIWLISLNKNRTKIEQFTDRNTNLFCTQGDQDEQRCHKPFFPYIFQIMAENLKFDLFQ